MYHLWPETVENPGLLFCYSTKNTSNFCWSSAEVWYNNSCYESNASMNKALLYLKTQYWLLSPSMHPQKQKLSKVLIKQNNIWLFILITQRCKTQQCDIIENKLWILLVTVRLLKDWLSSADSKYHPPSSTLTDPGIQLNLKQQSLSGKYFRLKFTLCNISLQKVLCFLNQQQQSASITLYA